MRASLSQRCKNRLEHSLRFPKHILVPEPQNAKAAACEIPSALEILQKAFGVLPTVQFDD